MKIIFAGTPDFAVPTLQMLIDSEHQVCAVYTQPDRPAGRGRKLKPGPVKQLAQAAGIPVHQPETLKTDRDLLQLRSFDADLMVVVAYGIILPQSVLETPKLGCINVHGSLLPRWRGAAPIHRALLAGDRETGITIMQVVKKLDAGDMLHKEVCEITAQDTSGDLHDRLAALGAIGLQKVLVQLEQGAVVAEKQDENLVTYAEKLQKSEAQLDWNQSAIELDRKVRGLNPWPVAQTSYQGKALRIWKAEVIDGEAGLPAGTVSCHDKQVDVATGDGWLRLLEVQLPGGKRMDVQAFMNAHAVDGVRLGQ
ncbi:methionyl-tRNA formyltransferase [Methylomarinum sp. Ch1-1]|uniref:Methionyl-tRNA formyltransferase n=1 Tax=Methylomarinum roseum TaxID=3067653 RepID=A0AAU7NUZ3_9GAMM|nr:methionyl-tRNA formyltransferase [Methylomarinum sp. Ch1-1]MDP4519098.1 methionyl-tRNA formyltransferase [Methylomarinum sp. Ch1-1]